MVKRAAALNADQLAFTFEPPKPARCAASLAGLDRMVAAGVARALKEDKRSRREIAARMGDLLDEDVTAFMLDAYASEARDQHNISVSRFLALIAATERFDILDAIAARVGAKVLVGDEVHTALLGHLKAQAAELQQQIREAERLVRPISRERTGR